MWIDMFIAQTNAQGGQPLWNSLEITKIILSTLTPLVVLLVGFWVSRIAKRFEAIQWANQKIIEKRLALFDDLAPLFNDVLCFFTYIGNWKEQEPTAVVAQKRVLDRMVYVAAPLFSPKFMDAYNQFIGLCYETYTGWGSDAKLRTSSFRRREALGAKWREEWETCFSENQTDPTLIREAYRKLMSVFSEELRLGVRAEIPAGHSPRNWMPPK